MTPETHTHTVTAISERLAKARLRDIAAAHLNGDRARIIACADLGNGQWAVTWRPAAHVAEGRVGILTRLDPAIAAAIAADAARTGVTQQAWVADAIATKLGKGAACGSAGPVTGTVTRTTYDDPDTWTTVTMVGKVLMTQVHHDGPHWWVVVVDDSDTVHRVEVDEPTYDACRVGAHWATDRCAA